MTSLKQRILSASKIQYTNTLADSDVYNNKDEIPTPIPGLNIAFSSRVDGGLTPGLTVFAGPSKHFKTLFCLISAAAYMRKYPDAICLFFDSEFGSPKEYFASAGVDPERVIHTPVLNLEELRTEMANQLNEITRGDKVVIIVDSLGNLASKKEIKDAEDGSEKSDLTRARVTKSLFRIVTPHLRLKDIPMLVVAHTYETLEMFSKSVVSGGTGVYYAADNLYIIGRQQEKDGTGAGAKLLGYNFTLNVEKSRYVKEKSKIDITVLRTGGVMKWSGLFDLALEGGYLTKINNRSYGLVDRTTGEIMPERVERSRVENDGVFWKQLFAKTDFQEFIHTKYAVSSGSLISEEVDVNVEEEDDQED